MKNIKLKLICMSIIGFIIFIIGNVSYAATSKISVSSTNVKVGDTITVTITGNAASWNVNLVATGPATTSGTTSFSNATDGGENENVTIGTVKYTATGIGTINFSLNGQLVNSDYTSNTATGNASVTVSPAPTPTPPPTFSSVSETVYATKQVTFRSSYSTSSSSLGTIPSGATLTRIGVSSTKVDGYYWSKVTYNGKTGYVASSFLTTTKPVEEPSPSPEPEEEKSNDSTLKSLSITGVEFTPAFSSSVLTYIANVGPEVTEVEVNAEVNNEKAKYEVVGNKDLQDGENSVIITVAAEDGTVTNYEIKLIKGEEEIPLDVFKVVGIKENDEKVDIVLENPIFMEDAIEYVINLNEYMKSVDIQALLSSDVNQYEGTGIFDLVVGENKFTVILKQQGEGQKTKATEYRITINNPEKVVEQPVIEEPKDESKINFKLIIAIGAVAVITAVAITFAVLYYKKGNALEYAKPDYSFLREDEEVQNKEQKRTEEIEKNNITDDNNGNDEPRRRGGKHF